MSLAQAACTLGRRFRGLHVRACQMSSSSTELPIDEQPSLGELLENPIKLYRDCFRLADYLGGKQGNRDVLREQIRQSFRRNMHEKDPAKIAQMKEAAVRGLSNYMLHEAQRMAKEGQHFDEKDG